jgi:TRAP-type C4-dicarboxylate transport system permease small subunit
LRFGKAPVIAAADRSARWCARAIAVLGLGLLLCFAVATIADGLLRYGLASPIDAVRDLGGMIAAVAVACCIPIVMLERGNITIRFVSTFIGARAGRLADAMAAVLVEAILIGMAWQFYRFARQAGIDGNATWMLHVPTAPFWWIVDVLMWIGTAMQALVAVEYFASYQPERGSDAPEIEP